jgi:hypothetical protein
MRKTATTLLLVSTLVAGAMAAPSLYGQPSDSMMGHGMMGDKNTSDKGGMMGMMKQMSEMMDHCNSMMSGRRPNDQWRRTTPSTPDQSG